jgi:hypothetical protein
LSENARSRVKMKSADLGPVLAFRAGEEYREAFEQPGCDAHQNSRVETPWRGEVAGPVHTSAGSCLREDRRRYQINVRSEPCLSMGITERSRIVRFR